MNIFQAEEEIYSTLKAYIDTKDTEYGTKVAKYMIEKQEPLILFSESKNQLSGATSNWGNHERLVNYNINIYCNTVGGTDSVTIAKFLANLVNEVMGEMYKLKGGIVANFPNYDGRSGTYSINMRYDGKYYPNQQILF